MINPGGLTHTSVAFTRDALMAWPVPFIEVHISNIHKREAFHHSFLSSVAKGVICGLGTDGYRLAIDFALKTF